MGKRTQKKKVLKEIAIFLIKFNVLLIPFYAIIYFDVSFYPLQIFFANMIAFFLKLFSLQVSSSDFILYLGSENFPIDISLDCIGWKSGYSLFALVFATPGKIKNKLKYMGIWIPLLVLINFFRVISSIVLGYFFGFEYIEPIHTYFWQPIMLVIVLAIWYLWLKREKIYRDKL